MKFRDKTDGGGGGKDFLKLKDKDEVRGSFRGEVTEFYSHWKAGGGVVCPGRDKCALCQSGKKEDKASFRFRLNFITRETEGGPLVAKVFEQGWTVYETLRDLNKDYKLEETIVKISRKGSGPKDTSYSILPIKEWMIKPDLEAKLALVPLQNLDPFHVPEEQEVSDSHEPPSFSSEASPF